MGKPKVPASLQVWVDARNRYHLSHAHVQMARELGMNPKKLGGLATHRQEQWKRPLPEFIEALYERRFGRRTPEHVMSLEERAAQLAQKKVARRERRATQLNQETGSQAERAGSPLHGPSPGKQVTARRVAASEMNVSREAAAIVGCALRHEARLVSIGPLLLFSTETGDAWLLDPADGLARCLASNGTALPAGIVETEVRFAIEWQATYALDGDVFVLSDHSGRIRAIMGYPVEEIRRFIALTANT